MASEFVDNPMGCADLVYTPQQVGDSKSWVKLKAVVKETRKLVTSLASRVPTSFTFRTQQTANGTVTRSVHSTLVKYLLFLNNIIGSFCC